MRIKTVSILTITLLAIMMLSGCKTQQMVIDEETGSEALVGVKESIAGEWILTGLDEDTQSLDGTEKESYETYLEKLVSNFSLILFPDGTYSRDMSEYNDRGTWRLVNGETGIELYSDNNEHNTAYDISEYNEPRLTLITEQGGVKKKYFLKRGN